MQLLHISIVEFHKWRGVRDTTLSDKELRIKKYFRYIVDDSFIGVIEETTDHPKATNFIR
jgi:hypothetical protein